MITGTYSEATLITYVQVCLKVVGAEVALTTADYNEIVNDTLLAYGVTDIVDCVDNKKVRTLAKREALRAVIQAMQGSYAFPGDGTASSPSKVYDKAIKMFAIACADALPYDGPSVVLSTATYPNDPYDPGFQL